MSQGKTAMRVLSVAVFLIAAVLAFLLAYVAARQEDYTRWSDAEPVGLTVFCGANVIAAALAALPGGSVGARMLGLLSLAPAGVLMNETAAGSGDVNWSVVALAASLVVLGALGGCCARRPQSRPGRRR